MCVTVTTQIQAFDINEDVTFVDEYGQEYTCEAALDGIVPAPMILTMRGHEILTVKFNNVSISVNDDIDAAMSQNIDQGAT